MAIEDFAALSATLLDTGLAAVFNATNDGFNAKISHIAFGDGAHNVDRSEVALQNEIARIPVGNGERITDHSILVQGVLDSAPQFWCREMGFVLSDGTFLAIWSHPTQPRWYKSNGVPVVVAFELRITELVPVGSVTWQTSGPVVNVTSLKSTLGTSIIGFMNFRRGLETDIRAYQPPQRLARYYNNPLD